MVTGADLQPAALENVIPGRPFRSYPALLSVQADAMAWARAGGPAGAVVVADYQAAPRGRAGLEWSVRPGASLGFSLILRPDLPVEREGWLYAVAASGTADAIGGEARIRWPDELTVGGVRAAAVAVHAEPGPELVDWAVVNVLVPVAEAPRGPLLRSLVEAIEDRAGQPAARLIDDYTARCETISSAVRARLIPMGPAGVEVAGRATRIKEDGALVIRTAAGNRVAVRPQSLGGLVEDRPGKDEGAAPTIQVPNTRPRTFPTA